MIELKFFSAPFKEGGGGGRILKPRFVCNNVSAAASSNAKKVTFSPSACFVCSNQRMISRISESLAEPMQMLQGFCLSSQNLNRCGKGSVQVDHTYAFVGRFAV